MNPANAAFIKRTASGFGLSSIRVVRYNVFDFFGICHEKFDIVFADPPYATEGLDTLPDRVFAAGMLASGGYFILEHPETYSFTGDPHFVKEKKYSNVHFSFFK
jgi:16S rRNA G966 N2-methylase RsmD